MASKSYTLLEYLVALDNNLKDLKKNAKDLESESLELSTYGKQVISQAITNKGVPTTNLDSFKKMADNIGLIDGGGVKQQPIYETINGQLYRVILNEDFSKKNYIIYFN